MRSRYKATTTTHRDCTIAGCIYSALYYISRPEENDLIPVCRKCAEELTAVFNWKLIREMTKEERENEQRLRKM